MKNSNRRLWDLWQVEAALACNLNCIMCPWHRFRDGLKDRGIMTPSVWNKLVPFLDQVQSVDFTGGGEPLLNRHLLDWIRQANRHGCETGFLSNGLLLNPEFSQELIRTGIDWLGISMDGADETLYEKIRLKSDFSKVCGNIKTVSELRVADKLFLMLNFVIMKDNIHQLEDMVRLASNLGVDQLNFKQCDVIRYDQGKGLALYAQKENRTVLRHKKLLDRARKLARKLKLKTTCFKFIPDEQPVCDQNPCRSMFIGYDGVTAPCINLAMGGPAEFMGTAVTFPTVQYGSVHDLSIKELWESEICRTYRTRFRNRIQIHDRILAGSDFGFSPLSMRRAFQDAVKAMPEALQGCRTCHYLYGV